MLFKFKRGGAAYVVVFFLFESVMVNSKICRKKKKTN